MGRTSISLHFGRGEPPSNDLRDYVSADDRWVLGGWIHDEPSMQTPLPEWDVHIKNNAIANKFITELRQRAIASRAAAYQRYYEPDEPVVSTPAPEFRPVLVTRIRGINSRRASERQALVCPLYVLFGANRALGKVNKNLFISELFFSLTPIRSAERIELGYQLDVEFSQANYQHVAGAVELPPKKSEWINVAGTGSFPTFKVGIRKVSFALPPATLEAGRLEERLHKVFGRFNGDAAVRFVTHIETPDGEYQWVQKVVGGLRELRPGILGVNVQKDLYLLSVRFDMNSEGVRLPCLTDNVSYADTDHRVYISASLWRGGSYSIVDFEGPYDSNSIMGAITATNVESPSMSPIDYTEVLLLRWAYLSRMFKRPRGIAFTYDHRMDGMYKITDVTFRLDPFEFVNHTTANRVLCGIAGTLLFNGQPYDLVRSIEERAISIQPGEKKQVSFTWEVKGIYSEHREVDEVEISLSVWPEGPQNAYWQSYSEQLDLSIR